MSSPKRLQRLKQYYAATAVLLLNLIVLSLVLNVIAWPVLRLFPRPTSPPFSVEQLREVYPGMSPSEIPLLLAETWDRQWQYEPWVGFRERPRRGKYVNVSDEGFRFSNTTAVSLDSRQMQVYVFGGSTTFGYGLDDRSTIPARVQSHLDRLLPRRRVEVVNFGRAYYYSTQELALLVQLLRSGRIPRVALFIDGMNEGRTAPYYATEMSRMFEVYTYAPWRLLTMAFERTPLVSLAHAVRERRRATSSPDPSWVRAEWLRNRQTIQSLAREFGFSAYFFLQPVPGYRNKFAHHKLMTEDGARMFRDAIPAMEALETTVDRVTTISLTALLEDYGKQPFLDDLHYTAEVADAMAARISDGIARDRRLGRD